MVISSEPTISVLLPVYNSEAYIAESIESILNQTFSDFELLIYNDGSTDGSEKIVAKYARIDSRIRTFAGPNSGLLRVLQRGVGDARGDYIARMDSDDIAVPERFEKQLSFLNANPSVVAVGAQVLLIDPQGRPLQVGFASADHESIDEQLLRRLPGVICHPTVMMRRAAVLEVGGYQQSYHFEDVDLFLRLAETGRLANIMEPLLKYRLHPDSVTHTRDQQRLKDIYFSIVQEACSRRQIPVPSELRAVHDAQPAKQSSSKLPAHVESYRTWSAMAAQSGHRWTALVHATNSLLAAPTSKECLWTLCNVICGAGLTRFLVRATGVLGGLFRSKSLQIVGSSDSHGIK